MAVWVRETWWFTSIVYLQKKKLLASALSLSLRIQTIVIISAHRSCMCVCVCLRIRSAPFQETQKLSFEKNFCHISPRLTSTRFSWRLFPLCWLCFAWHGVVLFNSSWTYFTFFSLRLLKKFKCIATNVVGYLGHRLLCGLLHEKRTMIYEESLKVICRE